MLNKLELTKFTKSRVRCPRKWEIFMENQWTVETGPELGPHQEHQEVEVVYQENAINQKPKKRAKFGSRPKPQLSLRNFAIAPKGLRED